MESAVSVWSWGQDREGWDLQKGPRYLLSAKFSKAMDNGHDPPLGQAEHAANVTRQDQGWVEEVQTYVVSNSFILR